ncbi:MAG: VWA domain-containing protein [Candidatus Hydrogenedentes bacterium]|nr:VWA domain-containing protein [Candidatus Hydrogenedentota bacterium]
MKLMPDDERLIDFALGELEADEAAQIAAALKEAENAEALAVVREYQGLASLSTEALALGKSEGLDDAQRAAVLEVAAFQEPAKNISPFNRYVIYIALAASVLFMIGGLITQLVPSARFDMASSSSGLADRYNTSILPLQTEAEPELQEQPAMPAPEIDAYRYAGNEGLKQEAEKKDVRVDSDGDGLTTIVDELSNAAPPAAPASVEARPEVAAQKAGAPADAPVPTEAKAKAKARAGVEVQDMTLTYYATPNAPQPAPAPAEVSREALENRGYSIAEPQAADTQDFYGHDGHGDAVALGVPFQTSSVAPGLQQAVVGGIPEQELRRQQWQYQVSTNEAYGAIVENPFKQVRQEPLSTFSIDVDTAGYSNVRRFLHDGQRPPRDAVRIEELVNYFKYSYPEPEGEHPLGAYVQIGPCPWNPQHQLAQVAMKAKSLPKDANIRANLVFLIDVSGSMDEPNKLPLVRESLLGLVRALKGNHRIGIVTYAGSSGVALPSTSTDDRAKIEQLIGSLQAGGSTNGASGIQLAYEMARNNFIQGGVNRVLLATDGDFNVGTTDHESLMALIAENAKSGVFLTTLGYGMGNLKDHMLEQLADKGNGNYAYIDSIKEARRVLVEQASGTLVTVAKDVKYQLEFNPAKVAAYRLIGYENRMLAAQDFNDDTKDAGEVGAGHTVTALYELVPAGQAIPGAVDDLKYQSSPSAESTESTEFMTVKVRYKQPDGQESVKFEVPVNSALPDLGATSPDFRFSAGVAAFGMCLRESTYKGSATLDMAHELAATGVQSDEDRKEFLDLVVTARTLR